MRGFRIDHRHRTLRSAHVAAVLAKLTHGRRYGAAARAYLFARGASILRSPAASRLSLGNRAKPSLARIYPHFRIPTVAGLVIDALAANASLDRASRIRRLRLRYGTEQRFFGFDWHAESTEHQRGIVSVAPIPWCNECSLPQSTLMYSRIIFDLLVCG